MSRYEKLFQFLNSNEIKLREAKLKTIFEHWLEGSPVDLSIEDFNEFVLMKSKIKLKLAQAIKILDYNGWSGIYLLLGSNGSGKTQFLLWLMHEINNKIRSKCVYIDLTTSTINDVLKKAIETNHNTSTPVGLFLDSLDVYLIEKDYAPKIRSLLQDLLQIEAKLIKIFKSVFIIITVNQSTWSRLAQIEINNMPLKTMINLLPNISTSIDDLRKIKNEIARKMLALYFIYSDSKQIKQRLQRNARLVTSFLKRIYSKLLRDNPSLKELVTETSKCVQIFVEHLNEDLLIAHKEKVRKHCISSLGEYLTRRPLVICERELRESYGINAVISMHPPNKIEDIVSLIHVDASCDLGNVSLDIPVLFYYSAPRSIKSYFRQLNEYESIISVLFCDHKCVEEMFKIRDELLESPFNLNFITLDEWMRQACYLDYEGLTNLVSKYSQIDEQILLNITSIVLSKCADVDDLEVVKDKLKTIIMYRVSAILIKIKQAWYWDYREFILFIQRKIFSELRKIGFALSTRKEKNLINAIQSIMENESMIMRLNNGKAIFRRDKLNLESIPKIAKKLAQELHFRVQFLS